MSDTNNNLGDTAKTILRALLEHGALDLSSLLERFPSVSRAAMRKNLQRLKERHLLEYTSERWIITTTGTALLSEAARTTAGSLFEHPAWGLLLETFPLPEMRAAFRITAALALVKNTASAGIGLIPWLGLAGNPGTGKSHLGRLAVEVLGGLEVSATTATSGEVLGRRVSTGKEVIFEPSPLLDGGVALIDELDKASGDMRGVYFQLLEGRSIIKAEGAEYPHRAAVLATWNPSKGDLAGLSEGVARRSIVLDTRDFTKRLQQAFQVDGVASKAWDVLRINPVPWVNLNALRQQHPPQMPQGTLKTARALLFDIATPQGREQSDAGILEALATGYALLGLEPSFAIAEALHDLCMVRATRPTLIVSDWASRVGQLRARLAPVTSWALETTTEREPDAVRLEERRKHEANIQLEARRGQLIAEIDHLRESFGRTRTKTTLEERTAREGFLAALRESRRQVSASNTLEGFQTAEGASRALLVPMHQWLEQRERQRQNEQHQIENRRMVETQRLKNAQAQEKQAREFAREHRKTAKALQQAVSYKDSPPNSKQAKIRQQTIAECFRRYLRTEHPNIQDPPMVQGFLASIGRGVKVMANDLLRMQTFTVDRATNKKVIDLDAWMLDKAASLESGAIALESGDFHVLGFPKQVPAASTSIALSNFKTGGMSQGDTYGTT